jgi:hypothetical protein
MEIDSAWTLVGGDVDVDVMGRKDRWSMKMACLAGVKVEGIMGTP